MSKDNKDKETYQAGISNSQSYPATKKTEPYQEHPIATLDEPLVGWLMKKEKTPMPEILMVNGVIYQQVKIKRW